MASSPEWTSDAHPTPEQLLLANEGELSATDAAPILLHQQQCWQCRGLVERQTRAIEAYVHSRETLLNPVFAPGPGAWIRMAARLRQTESSAPVAPRASRFCALWLTVTAAVVISIAAAVLLFAPAQLTAAVVLDRALRSEIAAGRPLPTRVVMRRRFHVIRGDDATLRQAYIDPRHPLSVQSFGAWRDSLSSRRDSVRAADREIRVETFASEGLVAMETLTLAQSDYRPKARHVEMRDGTVIDIGAEEAPSTGPGAETAPASAASSALPNLPGSPGSPAEDQRDIAEMDVRWALHGIDADLGNALEVRSGGDGVTVSGTLDVPAVRDRIESVLRALPHVSTHLTLASADPGMLDKAQPLEIPGALADPLLSTALARDLPNVASRQEFILHALSFSRDLLRHGWALRRLADRYPQSVEQELPRMARDRLQAILGDHARRLRAIAGEAAVLWKPFVDLTVPGRVGTTPWQNAAQEGLQSAESLDHLTIRLLTEGGDDISSAEEAFRRMRRAYGTLAVSSQENQ
jgi:hypothetical protein